MDIYREELLELYKNPHNKGAIKDPTVSVDEKNPYCGDEIELQLKIEKDVITEAKFDGPACMISVISSQMLTEHIVGKSLDEVRSITKKDLLAMVNINLSTSRVQCATLVLKALTKALEEYEQDSKDR